MVDLSEKLLQEESGGCHRQQASLDVEAHEFDRFFELPALACHLREQTFLDEHSRNLGALRLVFAVNVDKQFILEGDATDPDIETLCDHLPVLIRDSLVLLKNDSKR